MTASNEMDRRDFIKAGAAITAASFLGCSAPKVQTKTIPVGLQLYSVRKECEMDLPGTIAAVSKMGYQGVEFAGYYNYPAQELRKMLDDNGLKCCGTHTQLVTLLGDELPRTIEFNQILGNKYLIVPWLGEELRNSKEAWLKTATLFNELAEKVQPQGMVVGYHNHSFEFQLLENELPWDIFFSHTDPKVVMQIDTGNAMSGGGDPVAFLGKYPGRTKTIHLKEFSSTNPKAILGEGEVDWDQVFTLCESVGGTEWYIIEEEKDVYPPLECVDLCLKNYKKLRA